MPTRVCGLWMGMVIFDGNGGGVGDGQWLWGWGWGEVKWSNLRNDIIWTQSIKKATTTEKITPATKIDRESPPTPHPPTPAVVHAALSLLSLPLSLLLLLRRHIYIYGLPISFFFKGTHQKQQEKKHGQNERVATLHIFTRGRKLFFTHFFRSAPGKAFCTAAEGRSIAGDSLNFFHCFRLRNARGCGIWGWLGVGGGALNARNDNKSEINFMQRNEAQRQRVGLQSD